MADELDRVRISAAELRAKASTLADSEQGPRGEEAAGEHMQEESASHQMWEGKRPDLQRYRPPTSQGQRCQDRQKDKNRDVHGDGLCNFRHKDNQKDIGKEETRRNLPQTANVEMEKGVAIEKGYSVTGLRSLDTTVNHVVVLSQQHEANCETSTGLVVQENINHILDRDEDSQHSTSVTGMVNSESCCRDEENQAKPVHGSDPAKSVNSRDLAAAYRSKSPKPVRRIRKPDREIYQPGGRRLQQQCSKDVSFSKEPEETDREEVKRSLPAKSNRIMEEKITGREREEKGGASEKEEKDKGKPDKQTNGKQDQKIGLAGRGRGKKEGCNKPTTVESLTSIVERMKVSEKGNEESKKMGKKGGIEDEGGGRQKKTGSERTRNKVDWGSVDGEPPGRVEGGGGKSCQREAGGSMVEKKEKGNRRNRGGDANWDKEQKKRGKGMEYRWEVEPEERRVKERERETAKETLTCQIREGDRLKERNRYKDIEMERVKDIEQEHAQEGSRRLQHGGSTKAGTASKRYSKSDKRCSRTRTYSTSSASSGTSMDGPGDVERHRGQSEIIREWGQGSGRIMDREGERRDWGGKLWKKTGKNFSSTDSLEETETGRDARKRRQRDREKYRDENWSPDRGAEVGGKGSRGGAGGRNIDKQSDSTQSVVAASEDPHRHQEAGTRGRGRGILILPAHTDITLPPDAGPRQLTGSGRGTAGLGRGRGGRGGATRRLWDPNNPEQKPALTRGQQAQQQPLHLQQQGGYGQLHFLDTDDEVTGSPPICQGEPFHSYSTSQQPVVTNTATMAYYKFQNSDNPYYYQSSNSTARYPYPYHIPFQIPGSNGIYPSPGTPFYGAYGQSSGSPGYAAASALTPEEAEVQTRGELGKLLRIADSQELQLSNLLSRDKLSPEGLERMGKLRAELLALYEHVILTDIEFSDSQNLDQALWKNVFYQVIERFRQLLKDSSGNESNIRNMLLTLLDEGVVFFDALLQKLQVVFQFKLEDYMDGVAIRARPLRKTVKYALISAQRCMICQGDIARYREQACDSVNYGKARSWYLKAQHIAPKNGRPYNQLALLAVYTKRKLDAVYYYMRSLAASNPILTAKESLMSLFEETKRKADQLERSQQREPEGPSHAPRGSSGWRGGEPARVEIWVRPGGRCGSGSGATSRTGSESGRESEQDSELGMLTASDLNKRFILSFLHAHGKLFTKVGMETFPGVASHVLQEFRALLQHSPCPLGSTRMLQIVTINMFAVHNAQSREGQSGMRSVLEEQATALGLAMFALLVQRCTELLADTPRVHCVQGNEDCELGGDEVVETQDMVQVSDFLPDLKELLPSVKVWSDWMLGHPEQWNPPPSNLPLPCRSSPDVWQHLADLCNALASVDHGEAPLYKADGDGESDEDLRLLLLEEDRLLAGFVPLLGAPQEPCYTEKGCDTGIAADCKRVTVLKYFLEALCGQEEPLLAFKGGKYVSVAASPPPSLGTETASRQGKQADNQQDEDVIVEAESSQSEGEVEGDGSASEDDIRELRARRHALAHKLALQQKRQDKIQAVLQTCRQLEIEIRPVFLVPDTNCFIDHLAGLQNLLACGLYIIVVPLIVITELDGLARGQEHRGGAGGSITGAHARGLQERAKIAVAFLERRFEAREPCLRAMTSRGSQLESIAFRSEDTSGQQGNNDDLILSCCLHYCKDKAKDFMPTKPDEPVRLHREVVLLTDDRNLRVKALTRNVPVRDVPAFLKWAKVG
ncbi:telomerase-binding protein EST1A isoform X1 [Arapaima gigas]